jgi:type I restriction enzyme R subunit
MPFEFGFPLRDYQKGAIKAVENALATDRRSMLLAMATGTGKTKLAIAMLYRLLATKRFRRICFVVDRSALGDQAAGEFATTKIVSGKAFADIFGLKRLADVSPETETKVHICTIQGLVKRILYATDRSGTPPVDQYDLMVIDECHRGYLLDREMSDAELSFRGQEDYISKYRHVLEYFDAVKIGLTATPALHTTEIFGDPIFTYSYRQAVIDGYLIDHEPPIRIETALARAGIVFAKDEPLELLNIATGEVDLTHAPDEIRYDVEKFNRQVVTTEFNRVVAEANMPAFGKTRPLTVDDFAEFENAYGNDPNGGGKRKDEGEERRWRCFTREAIKARNDNLDIGWLRDTEAEAEEQLTEPEDIAAAIIGHLKAALADIEELSDELEPNGTEEVGVPEAAE